MPKILHIKHPFFEATILEQGAQLIHYKPQGTEKVLWHCDLKNYQTGKPFRGGIPICWPWFGKKLAPAHGFARIMHWTLLDRHDSQENVYLKWQLKDNDQTRIIWNYPFELILHMYLGKELKLTLEINTDILTTGALHTYFFVADVRKITLEGLQENYINCLSNDQIILKDIQPLVINQEIDRIYTQASSVNYIVNHFKKIHIIHHHSSDVVVWNPWKKLNDMCDTDYLNMLCVETARISKKFECNDQIGVTIRTNEKS